MPDGSNHTDLLATSSLSQLGHSDAPLLESYARWLPLERERLALNTLYNARQGDEPAPELDARYERYTDHWHDQAAVIRDTPATTPEGLKAKLHIARSVLDALTYLGQPSKGDDWTTGEQFAWAALNDALPADPAATNPMLEGLLARRGGDNDAALLAACAAFTAIETMLYALDSGVPDVEHRSVLDRYHDAYTTVDAIRPVTLAGLKAKTRVMQSGFVMQEIDGIDEDAVEWQIRGAWHLFQDIAAFGSTAPTSVAPSDPDNLVATASVIHTANGDLARAFQHFVAVDRRYDEGADTRAEEVGFVQEWDASLSGIAAAPAHSVTDCATKAMALLASIRREMSDGQTEADLSPQLALAWRMAKDLVGLTGGLPDGGIPHSGENPDAELMAACSEYLRAQWAFEAAYLDGDDDMPGDDPAWALLDPIPELREKIVALSATTPAGITARGRCLAFHYLPHHPACRDNSNGSAHDRFRAATMRDLVQMERGAAGRAPMPHPCADLQETCVAVPPVANPDAMLIKLCEQFTALEDRHAAVFADPQAQGEDPVVSAATGKIMDKQLRLARRMAKLRAHTAEGYEALAKALLAWAPDTSKDQNDLIDGLLMRTLLCSLTGGRA